MEVKKFLKATSIKVSKKVRKNAPEILMTLGIGTMIGGTIVAVRVTEKKVAPRKQQKEDRLDSIAWEVHNKVITKEEALPEIKKENRSCTIDVVKAYALPVTMEVTGMMCIMASNHIMRKRVAGLATALTTVTTAFDQYRERVRERYGEDIERSIYLNEKEIEVETTDEKGKTKKEKITVADPNISTVGRYVTRANRALWSDSDTYMEYQFQLIKAELTDRFRADPSGFMNLNTMYERFDFKKTGDGLVLGQLYDYNKHAADNEIDITWVKCRVLDENGNYEDAWFVDFPSVRQIYEDLVE